MLEFSHVNGFDVGLLIVQTSIKSRSSRYDIRKIDNSRSFSLHIGNLMVFFQLSKPASSLISIENAGTIVLYTDGTCESLEYAIETRKEKKDLSLPQFNPIIDSSTVDILSSTYFKTANDSILLTYFVRSRETRETNLIYYKLDNETLRLDGPINRLKLVRDEANIRLCGFTVVDSNICPSLVTICK